MPLQELWEGITSKNMREIRHMSICIRGVLNWKPNKLQLLFEGDKGEKLSVDEIKKYLYDKISEGFEYLPISEECDNFDPKKGCLGHPVKTNDEPCASNGM